MAVTAPTTLRRPRGAAAGVPPVQDFDPRNRTVPLLIAVEQGSTVPAHRSALSTGTPLVAVVGETPGTAKAV